VLAGADVEAKGSLGRTPVSMAQDKPEILAALRNPGLVGQATLDSLHDAIRDGDLDDIARFVEESEDLNGKDEDGDAPLYLATLIPEREKAVKVVGLLLAAGADTGVTEVRGWTPLHGAACHLAPETAMALVKMLLDRGADVDAKSGVGWTALHLASGRPGRRGVVEILLESGANINERTSEGVTPLHRAVFGEAEDVEALLIERGADTRPRAGNGLLPHEYTRENVLARWQSGAATE